MKIVRTLIMVSLSVVMVTSSCVSRKKLTYLQYSLSNDDNYITSSEARTSVTPASYKVMPYDNLYIRVVTPDPQYSELFNTMPSGTAGAMTEESAGLVGYPIDGDGYIEIPFVGKVDVAGKTLAEIKTELDSIFKKYVTDASLTVRLVNNYISIIGEVNSPGRYPLSKERVNIFEAISMAGDLTVYGNRQKVQLIRSSPYGPTIKEFTLLDRSILSSEFYYLEPNDILYVVPLQGKANELNISIYSLFLTTISTALVIISYFRLL